MELTNARVSLPFGSSNISITLPGGRLSGVFSPEDVTPCPDPGAEIRRALRNPASSPPLRKAASGSGKVVIITDDITRMTPLQNIIPLILEDLGKAGIGDDRISILIGLGTHRPMTEAEIRESFGPEITKRIAILNHPWQDRNQLAELGMTANGTPVSVARQALEADFLIGVGSIVPHHIPGFSGGAKIVQPGITGAETTGATHLLSVRSCRSWLGVLENPVRKEMEEIAARVGLSAILNCVLNPAGDLVRAFYGDYRTAFRKGADCARRIYGVEVPAKSDIVIAGSYPCDIEFWQAHKALYPAEKVVRAGGRIIVVTPCPEGVAVTHQDILEYGSLSPEKILALIEKGDITDTVSGALALAWAKVREHSPVSLVSDGISDEEARALGFTPFGSVEDAVEEAVSSLGSDATISVLTKAPDMLPVMENQGW